MKGLLPAAFFVSGRLDLQLLGQSQSDLLREATKMILAAFWPRFLPWRTVLSLWVWAGLIRAVSGLLPGILTSCPAVSPAGVLKAFKRLSNNTERAFFRRFLGQDVKEAPSVR